MIFARQLLQGIWHLIFPPVCAVCRIRLDSRMNHSFCHNCFEKITYLRQPICRMCGMELAGSGDRAYLCGECLRIPPPFSLARSLVRYEPGIQQLVQKLKYTGDTSVLSGITTIVRRVKLSEFADCDWIIPVPLHPDRHRHRGFNQATILAGLFFPEKADSIRSDWLIRTLNTTAQTTLSGLERRKNLVGAFQVRRVNQLERAVVCLVDDVFTTGTTVKECSKTLLKQGVKDVRVLTLARAIKTA